MAEIRYCKGCKRTDLTPLKSGERYRGHAKPDGTTCLNRKVAVKVYPPAPEPKCLACEGTLGDKDIVLVKDCLRVVDTGRGRNTYMYERGARVYGGAHRRCIVKVKGAGA